MLNVEPVVAARLAISLRYAVNALGGAVAYGHSPYAFGELLW
jgi:hypothetical protein